VLQSSAVALQRANYVGGLSMGVVELGAGRDGARGRG